MSLLALLPLIACAFVIVIAKRSAVVGAVTGLAVALVIMACTHAFSLSAAHATSALLDAVILTLNAAIVILQLFGERYSYEHAQRPSSP